MLLTSLALAVLSCPVAVPATPAATSVVAGDHGKIPWFKGSFEAALAQAKSENKLIFIDFWTDWCGWCKRLDKDTFSNDSVVAEMKDILCLSIDAESESGAPIAKKFAVRGFPALILLGPDGKAEDSIGGYLKPDDFKRAIQRVRSGEGTVSGFRKKIAADPSNMDLRLQLASKLESLGDLDGKAREIVEVKKLDPDGKSLAMRRIELQSVGQKINEIYEKTQKVDIALMAAFLAEEKHKELLFEGWSFMVQMNAFMAMQAENEGRPADAKQYRVDQRSGLKTAWSHVPDAQIGPFGNSLAWSFYEMREELSDEEKGFALEIATKANDASKNDVNVIDTYAACLDMNGKKEEAIRQIQRCIELQPDNQQWKERLAQLQS
ncbi:MAG: thioredoxin family protein [Planctomycetota bacterium]